MEQLASEIQYQNGDTDSGVTERLIEFIRQSPMFYDRQDPTFKDKGLKKEKWEAIARQLGFPDGTAVMNRWNNLRDVFRKVLRKAEVAGDSEKAASYRYYEQMKWIKPYLQDGREMDRSSKNSGLLNNSFQDEGMMVDGHFDPSFYEPDAKETANEPSSSSVTVYSSAVAPDDRFEAKLRELLSSDNEARAPPPIENLEHAGFFQREDDCDAFGRFIGAEIRKLPTHLQPLGKLKLHQALYDVQQMALAPTTRP